MDNFYCISSLLNFMIEWALISWNQCLVFTRAPGFVLYHTIHSHKWTTLNSCRSRTLVFYILDTTDVDHNVEHIMLTYLLILFAPGDAKGYTQWSQRTTICSGSLHFTPGLSCVFDLSGQSSSPSFLWFSPLSFSVWWIGSILMPLLRCCWSHYIMLW